MPFDPFRGFKSAADIAEKVRSPYEDERKLQRELSAYRAKKDIDLESYKARSDYRSGALPGHGIGQVAEGSPLGEFSEDFITKPVIRSVRGVPTEMQMRELKPRMQESASQIIRSGRTSATGLARNLGMLTPDIERRMGPPQLGHLSAIKGGIGDLILNFQSVVQGDKGAKDFASFKSQSDILFQQWRKFITGVQAAFPEIQMLTPDYPQPTDTPEIYKEKALKLMEQAQEVEGLVLDAESQRGFRTGELRKGGLSQNPLIQNVLKQRGGNIQPSEGTGKISKTRSGIGYSIES